MRIRIDRTRMAAGRDSQDYAYDGMVSLAEIDRSTVCPGSIIICRGRGEYVRFDDATRPAELNEMELGWERYQASMDHEKRALARLLELAKSVYPELAPATRWPSLWVSIPGLDVSHDTRYVEMAS